mmetsp:Transcript_122614/g.216074  ORF Transcript_122614/g.216074 Transcript_122614/m.216074 type:complete len:310 (-) Transcript_122614:27-956(-)
MGGGSSRDKGSFSPGGGEDTQTMQIRVKTQGNTGPLGNRRVHFKCPSCCCGVWVYEDKECCYGFCRAVCTALLLVAVIGSFLSWYYLRNRAPHDSSFDICPSQTGVTCSQQSDCSETQECFHGQCFCRVGFCAILGQCEESCQKSTAGTCSVLDCDVSRGPTDCLGMPLMKKCYCKKGYCHINGKCRDAICSETATQQKCSNESPCPSSLGLSTCEDGLCQCSNSTCLENNVCVDLAERLPYSNYSLSDIEPIESLAQNQMQQSTWTEVPLVLLGSFMFMFVVLISVFKMQVQRRQPSDFAQQLLTESK